MNKEQLQKILGDRNIVAENYQFLVNTDCLLINGDGICVIVRKYWNGNYMVKYDASDYLVLHNRNIKRVEGAAKKYSVQFDYLPSFYLSNIPSDKLLGAVQRVANASAFFINKILDE